LSRERVLESLMRSGLTRQDSQVYLYLSKKGLQKGRVLARSLGLTKQQLYRSLKNLQRKGIVNATLERPARFSAVPLEKVLDSFLKAKIEETRRLQQDKKEILSEWQSTILEEHSKTPPKFNVIEGRSSIYPKIQQMIQESHSRISTVASVKALIQANQFGLFDPANNPPKSKVEFRFLTGVSKQNQDQMKTLLSQMTNARINFEGRTPTSGVAPFPRMVIKDEDEIIFFITPKTNTSIVEQNDVCLWTNCKPLVQAFSGVFEELWRHATNIEQPTPTNENMQPARR
jgi:sugar-specific transcriptional regulator TrmB